MLKAATHLSLGHLMVFSQDNDKILYTNLTLTTKPYIMRSDLPKVPTLLPAREIHQLLLRRNSNGARPR